MKIHPVGAKSIHEERWMDMMEEIDPFHNFVNTPKKSLLTIIDVHQYMTLFYFFLKHDSIELYCTVILHTSDIKP
jgi:hypothetical protein